MFDILDDELREMYGKRKSRRGSIEKAISLSDSISSIPVQTHKTISKDACLQEAINILQQNHIGCIIVESNTKIVGIITERDILLKVVGKRLNLDSELVSNFMTSNPECLRSSDPIAFALNKMATGGFRNIPIVDDNEKLIAVVTISDIINHLGDYFFDEIINLPPNPVRQQSQREGG
jgi:predicted transcriptional regulator